MDREDKLGRETLVSKDQRFFGHDRGARIALGRFIVTKYGGIIDIQARKVIHDEKDGEVLGLEDGKVVYRIDNSFRVSGLFSFNLKEFKVATVKQGSHWDLPGLKSPDKLMSVVNEITHGVIRLYRLGQARQELAKGASFTYSELDSPFGVGAPCLWLDGEHILTAQTNRTFVILTTQGTLEKPIEVKDAPAEILGPPYLWRDGRERSKCGLMI